MMWDIEIIFKEKILIVDENQIIKFFISEQKIENSGPTF